MNVIYLNTHKMPIVRIMNLAIAVNIEDTASHQGHSRIGDCIIVHSELYIIDHFRLLALC
jgi:hypothetical protein